MPIKLDIQLLKKISVLALPVMLSNMLQASISVIDTIMIGRLGPIAIAAVGMGNTLRLFVLILILSVAGGAISLMAQAKGSRDVQRMSKVTRQAIVSGLLLSLFLGGVGYMVAKPLLNIMNQGGEIEAVTLGTDYLQVLVLGTPFLLLNVVTNKLMQGAGDTVTPLLITIAVLLLNVGFNYIFIFGWAFIPAYGVVGAAFGTILARAILLAFTIWLFYSGKNVVTILKGTWLPNWSLIKDILTIGVPSGIQGVFRHGSNIVSIGLVTATPLGTYGAAVLAIGMQIEQIVAQPIVGLNVAATSLIGQDLGKWQTKAAYQKGVLMTTMGVLAMSILVLPTMYFIPEIIHLFDPSAHPKVLEGSLSYFKYTLPALVLSAIGIMMTGTLRGSGDTQPAMYSAIFNRNLVQLGLGWFLAFPMAMGYIGIWFGIIAGRILDAVVLSFIWWKRHWLQIALKKTAIYRIHLKHYPKELQQQFLKEVRGPLMAQKGMVERVENDRVKYVSSASNQEVIFQKNNYQISVK